MGKYKERVKICLGCNKEFKKRCKSDTKYCSKKCYDNSKRPNVTYGKNVECNFCGKYVYKTKGSLKKSKNFFCSTYCANKFQSRNKLNFTCKTCGKNFKWSKSRIKENNPTYCTLECRNNDPEWIENACAKGNFIQQNKKGLNKLELLGRQILNELDLKFDEQVLIANKFLVDVFIKDYNLIIQWDGNYWHGHSSKLKNGVPDKRQNKRIKNDYSQNKYFKKCGFNVLRFWEHEVMNEIKQNDNYIKNSIRNLTNQEKEEPKKEKNVKNQNNKEFKNNKLF